jgi:tRNA (guanine-N7-)-methyltransferase
MPSGKPETPNPLPAGWWGAQARPLEIDVGCHKGRFLADMAERFPDHNFLGIEHQAERVERAWKKIRLRGLDNAAVVCAEGVETLAGLPDGAATWIHVLFPDPWPKRRHHIRRLVQEDFLAGCRRVLAPGGLLRLVTDDAPYAAAIRAVAARAPGFAEEPASDRDYPITEFQSKFLAEGRPVFTLFLRRVP